MPGLSRSHVLRLWIRFSAVYGHRWVSSHGETDHGDTWLGGLQGITSEQLDHGIKTCIEAGHDWPPTLPEFRDLCLGIPHPGNAISILRSKTGFARLMLRFLDKWTYDRANEPEARRLAEAAYREAADHLRAGGKIPDAPAALLPKKPEPKPVPAGQETVSRELSRMKSLLGQHSNANTVAMSIGNGSGSF